MHNDFLTLLVGNQEYKVRPTFQAASYIENKLGKPLAFNIDPLRLMSLTTAHAFLYGAITGSGHKIDSNELGDALIADYATQDTPLLKAAIAFGDSFFPKVETQGAKKQTATEVTG